MQWLILSYERTPSRWGHWTPTFVAPDSCSWQYMVLDDRQESACITSGNEFHASVEIHPTENPLCWYWTSLGPVWRSTPQKTHCAGTGRPWGRCGDPPHRKPTVLVLDVLGASVEIHPTENPCQLDIINNQYTHRGSKGYWPLPAEVHGEADCKSRHYHKC